MNSGEPQRPRANRALNTPALIAVVIAALSVFLFVLRPAPAPGPRSTPLPIQPISLSEVPVIGDRAAPVAIVEFSDFQCPFCGAFTRETLPVLKATYVDRGIVQMGYLHLPLANHSRAPKAAEAAECASRQSRFWPMHDRLFTDSRRLDDEHFQEYAREIGLDPVRFSTCLDGQASPRVQRDAK